jgi:hypothetical protein
MRFVVKKNIIKNLRFFSTHLNERVYPKFVTLRLVKLRNKSILFFIKRILKNVVKRQLMDERIPISFEVGFNLVLQVSEIFIDLKFLF